MNSKPTTIHPQDIVLKNENVNVYYCDFLAVKVDTSGINSAIKRTKAERKQLRLQFPGEKIFICPGLCGDCTKVKDTPHACGNNNEFANTKIVIPVH